MLKRICLYVALPIFIAIGLIGALPGPTAYAQGEKYKLSSDKLTLTGSSGNFEYVFGQFSNEVKFTSLGSSGYAQNSGMLVFYYEGKPDNLGQTCGSTQGAYVEVHINTKTNKTTQVLAACGKQSEQGRTKILPEGNAYNIWDQAASVSYTAPPSGSGSNSGQSPANISGTPTYTFDESSKDGSKIKACGGFYKQFGSDCVVFSQISSSSTSAAASKVGNGSVVLYSYNHTIPGKNQPCQAQVSLAISSTDRSLDSGSLDGWVGYTLSQGGADITDETTAKKAGCNLQRPTDKAKWEDSPGLPIKVAGADKLESFLGDPVEQGGDGASTCMIDGVGWIVCPVMTFMGGVGDAAYGLVSNFLDVNSKIMDTSSGTFTAWQAFRDIANAAFVLVFLVVIYSQITNAGIGSYGIKKMLPRLVIGAILVNASFFICQIMVDVTQILGASLSEFLKNIPAGAGSGAATELSWGDIIPGVLTGVGLGLAAVGGVAILALSISAPVLIAYLLAILMTVIILIARQAAIVILVVLAPLAFVAYLLPNTEQLFKKWLKMFWSLLLVYPVVALLYGGGALAARIIHNASSEGDFWLSITALGVSAIPLIMTPALLKGSMSATGALGAKLQGWGNKANAGVGRNIREKSRFGEASQGIKNKFALNGATRRANSRFSRAIDRGWVGKKLGLDRGSYAATEAVQKEATADAARTIKYEYDSDYVEALSSSNENVQAIAAGELVNRGEFGAKSVYDYLKNGGSITSVEMADALTKMKGAHAGLGEVGTAALKHFQSGNKEPFSATDAELVKNTEDGLAKLGNEALAKQSAAAIVEGGAAISASKAAKVLADQRLRNSMTADTERAFMSIARGRQANAGAAGNQPAQNQAPAGQAPAGTGGTPQQPTATPNLNNRQAQAKAKLNAAAQGTAGTKPFFVTGDGTTATSAPLATGSVKQAEAAQGTSGAETRVFSVGSSGDTTEQTNASSAGSTTDETGRQTPKTISPEDIERYHEKMRQ